MTFKNPKGGAVVATVISIVVTVAVVVLTGGIGLGALLVADSVSCRINIYWGCSSGGGGGSTYTAQVNDPCTSAPNSCGMTNTGFIVQTACTGGTAGGGSEEPSDVVQAPKSGSCGQCNATPPPNSACPAPTIGQGGFYATPSTVGLGGQSTLHWNASNSTGCSIAGDNGFAYSGDTSGTVSTGALSQTTLFTITCENGDGGSSASASARVIIDPQYREI